MAGRISIPRTLTAQPDQGTTRKGQKRYTQTDQYNAGTLNAEFDYIHERLNQITVEDPALTDLDSGAVLADVITRLNSITDTLRKAGLLRS